MAEGGILPWRTQRPDGMVYATYEDLMKPLPPPPPGKVWKKVRLSPDERELWEEGVLTRWELVDKPHQRSSNSSDDSVTREGNDVQLVEEQGHGGEEGDPEFLTHVVLPTDTMAGLRLRYKVTAAELRRYNDFFGERFQCCEVLRIPIKGKEHHVLKNCQKPTPEVIRQKFRIATKCTDDQIITYYLEFNEWDLSRAAAEYEEDREWEEKHRARMRGSRIPKMGPRTVVAPSAPYEPPTTVVVGPPPSYRSIFSINNSTSRLLGRKKGGSGSGGARDVVEMDNVVSSSMTTTTTSGSKTAAKKAYHYHYYRGSSSSSEGSRTHHVAIDDTSRPEEEPLLAMVVGDEYDFARHHHPQQTTTGLV